MDRIAVVGAGLIGRAWAMVFARAGLPVALWDKLPGVAEAAMGRIGESLADLHAAGLVSEAPEAIAARISPMATLAECVAGATHVQENGPERLEPKRELFAELGYHATSMRAIASAVGIQPAAIYHWYPSKEAQPKPLMRSHRAAQRPCALPTTTFMPRSRA